MTLVKDLLSRLEMGLIYHFFYSDSSVGVVKSRMRKILIVNVVHNGNSTLLVMQPSSLSKSSLGEEFPKYDTTKYKLGSDIENLNVLPDGVVVEQTYIKSGKKSWLFPIRELDGRLQCIKMAESLTKRSLALTETSEISEDNKELLEFFSNILNENAVDAKSSIVLNKDNKISVLNKEGSYDINLTSDKVMEKMLGTDLNREELDLTKTIQKVKANWFVRLIKWLFRIK